MTLPYFANVVGGVVRPAAGDRRLVSSDPVTGAPWAEAADSGEVRRRRCLRGGR